jgi:hypothetical protein
MDCSKEEFKPSDEAKCQVGLYVYGEDSGSELAYEITYLDTSLTFPSVIVDQKLVSGTWLPNATFKHIYRNDSIYIKDFKQFQEGATFLAGQLDSKTLVSKLQNVVTTYPANGGTYRYTFDYAQSDKITVTLEEVIGNTAFFDSRGVYTFDSRGDVVKLEITRDADRYASDPDPFTSRTITYTYDIVLNPLQYQVLVHYLHKGLPDVTYFSMHNRVNETYDGSTKDYQITYGTDPMPKQIVRPNGVVEKYEYPNCTN